MRTGIFISSFIIISIITALVVKFVIAEKGPEKSDASAKEYNIPTDNLENPEITVINKWDVPEILKEISGIAYLDGQRFACIQDEVGKIFIYNTATQKIEQEIHFAGVGDYEGLALNGKTAYVLRADGVIFEISSYSGAKPAVKEHKTHLTEKQNTEGLAFDKLNNRLLVAIKGKEPESDDYKGVYAFDLGSREMKAEPVFQIDLKNEAFAVLKSGKKKKASGMNPSEIAVNPLNGTIYITDGSTPKLLIMNKEGEILSLSPLKDAGFSQPEGMSFSPDGKLYISNEGTKRAGNILEVSVDTGRNPL